MFIYILTRDWLKREGFEVIEEAGDIRREDKIITLCSSSEKTSITLASDKARFVVEQTEGGWVVKITRFNFAGNELMEWEHFSKGGRVFAPKWETRSHRINGVPQAI